MTQKEGEHVCFISQSYPLKSIKAAFQFHLCHCSHLTLSTNGDTMKLSLPHHYQHCTQGRIKSATGILHVRFCILYRFHTIPIMYYPVIYFKSRNTVALKVSVSNIIFVESLSDMQCITHITIKVYFWLSYAVCLLISCANIIVQKLFCKILKIQS